MKACSMCNKILSSNNFNKCKNSKNGLQSRCRSCSNKSGKKHYMENKEKYTENRLLWRHKNENNNIKDKISRNKWRSKNPEKVREMCRKRHQRLRRRALEKIGLLICNNCGCDKYELLEINHIDGEGNKERKQKRTSVFYLDIIYGRRVIKDLEILCRPCNHIHYLELKYNKLPYEIKWRKQVE